MSFYVFPGYPTFLESAAAELGHPDLASRAGRIVPFTALANLCAQASHGHPSHSPAILARAAEFRDQLAIALRAADLMLWEVEAARDRQGRDEPVAASSTTPQAPPIDIRRARKGPTPARESS